MIFHIILDHISIIYYFCYSIENAAAPLAHFNLGTSAGGPPIPNHVYASGLRMVQLAIPMPIQGGEGTQTAMGHPRRPK